MKVLSFLVVLFFAMASIASTLVDIDKTPGLTILTKSSNNIVFKKAAISNFEIGTIIVGQDKQNKSGFLRRIKAIRSKGVNIDYATEQISIAEALQYGGDLRYTATFTKDNFVKSGANLLKTEEPIIDLSGLVIYSTNTVKIEIPKGTIKFVPVLDMDAEFGWFYLSYLKLVINGNLDVDLNVKMSANKTINISKEINPLPPVIYPIVTNIGPLPIYGKIEVKFPIGIEGNIKGYMSVQTGFDSSTPIYAGFIYNQGDWTNQSSIGAFKPNLHFPTYEIEGSSEIRVYVKPQVTLTLYETSGADLLTNPYLLEKTVLLDNATSIDFRLWAAIDAKLRLYINVFDHDLTNKTWKYSGQQYNLYATTFPLN